MKKSILYTFLFLSFIQIVNAQNPILKGWADPALKVWNGKMYMAVGKDRAPEITKFEMTKWGIYSSTDLVNWNLESEILPEQANLPKDFIGCWATDITFHKNKYYFYFSNFNKSTGVLVADKPNGPYLEVLKKPMLEENMSDNFEYDATTFTDDDGKKYLIYGRDGQLGNKMYHYQIVKLNDDMVSLATQPKDLLTSEKFGFGEVNRARDHQYFHKYNGLYYLSCGNVYMTSKTLYGPYEKSRSAGGAFGCHSSFADFNGQSYMSWENTCEPYGNRLYRQVMMTYLHYKDNGDMLVDENFTEKGKHYANGVGNYDANWDKIEAEWFFKKSGNILKKQKENNGFEIQNVSNEDYLVFPKIRNLKANAKIEFSLSSINGGTIEIREGSVKGKLIGKCIIPKTGTYKTYQTTSSILTNSAQKADLYFVFKGKGKDITHLDNFIIN